MERVLAELAALRGELSEVRRMLTDHDKQAATAIASLASLNQRVAEALERISKNGGRNHVGSIAAVLGALFNGGLLLVVIAYLLKAASGGH